MSHVMVWRMLVIAALVFASSLALRVVWKSLAEPSVAEAQSPAEGDLYDSHATHRVKPLAITRAASISILHAMPGC